MALTGIWRTIIISTLMPFALLGKFWRLLREWLLYSVYKYRYDPLDRDEDEIRVLRFEDQDDRTPHLLRCTLHRVSLNNTLPEYDLLGASKIWESPTEATRAWLELDMHQTPGSPVGAHWPNISARRFQEDYYDVMEISGPSLVAIPPRFTWGDFEAISYCWESEDRNSIVLVDGKRCRVTSNLEALLHQLRDLPEALTGMSFWIDGLCINQDDISEKNHQVSLMKRIYSEALSTIVWLGPGDSTSDRAMDMLSQSIYKYRPPDWSGADWQAIVALCGRNYFNRMWIIQELALNSNLSVFICGERVLPRERLEVVCGHMRSQAGKISVSIAEVEQSNSGRGKIDQEYVWRLSEKIKTLLTLSPSRAYRDHERLYVLAQQSQATDPKDKIYALLGLFHEQIATRVELDYAKTKETVYMEFASQMLDRCTRLDEVLSWCTFDESNPLPSWVPDWSARVDRNHIYWFRKRSAGGEGVPAWSLTGSGSILLNKGINIDTVDEMTSPSSSTLPYRATADYMPRVYGQQAKFGRYQNWRGLCDALRRTLVHDNPFAASRGDVLELHWVDWEVLENQPRKHILELTTETTDHWRKFDRFRQTNAHFSIFGFPLSEFFAKLSGSSAENIARLFVPEDNSQRSIEHTYEGGHTDYSSSLRELLTLLVVGLHGRRMMITRTGFLGLVPEETKVGDTVAILLGCGYPVILRPCGDGYKYVGECYIDGLMNGEAIEAANRGEYEVKNISIL